MPVFLLLYIISFIPYDKFQKACIAVILILWIKKLQRREVTLTSWSKPQAWVMKPDFSYFTAYVLITEFLPPLCSHMMCIWLAEVIQSLYFKDNPPPQHRQIKWFVQSPYPLTLLLRWTSGTQYRYQSRNHFFLSPEFSECLLWDIMYVAFIMYCVYVYERDS